MRVYRNHSEREREREREREDALVVIRAAELIERPQSLLKAAVLVEHETDRVLARLNVVRVGIAVTELGTRE